jgi:hypothetical protein
LPFGASSADLQRSGVEMLGHNVYRPFQDLRDRLGLGKGERLGLSADPLEKPPSLLFPEPHSGEAGEARSAIASASTLDVLAMLSLSAKAATPGIAAPRNHQFATEFCHNHKNPSGRSASHGSRMTVRPPANSAG